MEICFSSGSVWFWLTVVIVSLYFLFGLFKFILRLCFRPQSSNKRKKRAELKKKRAENKANQDVSVVNSLHSQLKKENKANKDVSVAADYSHPQLKKDSKANKDVSVDNNSLLNPLPEKDTKDFSVESVRLFTYQSLVDATQNFLSDWCMNIDGLGQVFRGQMVDTCEIFAIRRLKQYITQSPEEFVDEVLLLSQANHPNLAKLIGYSFKHRVRLLVYEYVPGGSLENYLHGNKICLDWKMRMKIVVGVARALEYLQNVMKPPILHFYIEPSNIWLDEECTPKLSGFGVVRMYPSHNGVDPSYETIGSYLYGLHDYSITKKVTLQADIRGFGIFLLEMITGRKGLFWTEDGVKQELTTWVQPYLEDGGKLDEMVDPKLEGKFEMEELYEVCHIAEACIQKQPSSRPLICDVVKRLECLIR